VGLTVLDAGPIIAVLDGADAHHRAAVDALRRLEESGDQLVIPAVTYAECLVHPARRGEPSMAAVDAYLEALPVSIEPVTHAIARRAAGLRAKHGKHLRLPDALVVATALELEANRILTTDTGWPRLTVEVEVIGR
jgi:predicted nucleic acid-binding protein